MVYVSNKDGIMEAERANPQYLPTKVTNAVFFHVLNSQRPRA